MFAPDGDAPLVDIQIVALGDTDRLHRCVTSLVEHRSDAPFTITCVVNPGSRRGDAAPGLPPGVRLLTPDLNLGWAGGLHLARAQTTAPYLAWAQDDMEVLPGWLDSLVSTLESDDAVGAVGSVEVDSSGAPNGVAGGWALPPDQVQLWNDTEAIRNGGAPAGTRFDWITSKGMLTRSAAWDEVGGTDPRLFPLNHVDKDYSVHLRAHGWTLAVAAGACLRHARHQSAPSTFRGFLVEWQEPDFDRRWGAVAAELAGGRAAHVEHECSEWVSADLAVIERLVGIEASRMVAPAARFAATIEREHVSRVTGDFEDSRTWRWSAPLRRLSALLRRLMTR